MSIPRLMQRRALSYRVSLLLVLLRKRMLEQDANSGDARLVVSRTEIGEMLRAFLVGSGNEAKVLDQLDKLIGKVVELGFLRALRETDADVEDRYEIRRVIKAFVDAQWMNEFNAKLEVYRQKAFGDVGDGS